MKVTRTSFWVKSKGFPFTWGKSKEAWSIGYVPAAAGALSGIYNMVRIVKREKRQARAESMHLIYMKWR
jgi:hypothetical protein